MRKTGRQPPYPIYHQPEPNRKLGAAMFVLALLIMTGALAGVVQNVLALGATLDERHAGDIKSSNIAQTGNVTLQFLGWYVAGSKVDDARAKVKLGDTVELRIRLIASAGISKNINIEIRKDVVWWPDSSFKSQTYPVTLSQTESKQLSVTFTPDTETGSLPLSCRQYFFKVSGIVVYDPTNPDTRECIIS